MSEFSEKEKLMVKLAYVAYEGFLNRNEQELYERISARLFNTGADQKLVWGPTIHRPGNFINWEVFPFKTLKDLFLKLSNRFSWLFTIGAKYSFVDALAYVIQNSEDEYTVVIRGTNMICLREWIYQDFMVKKMKRWSNVAKRTKAGKDAYISQATYNSIKIHQKLRPSFGAGKGKDLFSFLKGIISKSENKITINFTGHSLGGLMSSTLAVLLHDKLSKDERKKVNFFVYAFASPTAGNKEFAQYCDKILGQNCTRYVNELDVANYIWTEDEMKNTLPNLYEPTISIDALTQGVLNVLTQNIRGHGYTQLSNKKIVPSTIHTKGLMGCNYLAQLIYQHIYPYTSSIVGDFEEATMLKDVAVNILMLSDLQENVRADVIDCIEENYRDSVSTFADLKVGNNLPLNSML